MSKETAMALMAQDTSTAAPPEEKTPPAEAPAAPAEAAPTADASRLAIFAKKEAAILKEREEIKRERESLLKEKEEAEKYKKRGQEFDELFAKDKKAALRMIGLSDTDIINIIADQEEPAEETVEEKARKIAAEEAQKIRDEIKKEKEEAEAAQNEALITKLKSDLSSAIKANPDKYEYCAFEGVEAELQAYEVIVENLKENGELLTTEQALDICEEYYESRDKAMAALKKRQPKVEVTAEETTPAEKKAPTSNAAPKPTPVVTNRMTATSTGAAIARRETHEEKKQRLIEKLKASATA